MFFRAYFCSILFAVALWSSSTFAGILSVRGESDLPYHIKADSLGYDDATKTYRARGHVVISRGDQSLWADAVDLNAQTMETVATDNVRFTSGEDWLTGTRLEINLNAGTGTLYDGVFFIKESHFYIRGGKIEKIGEDSYHVADGSFTTCDGDFPAWQITGKDLRVTLEGYGTIKHAAFWAKSVPVLYVPYLVFPAKLKRQTGLLVPQVSYSNRDGFQYNQPVFWAISESSDATLYEHYMAQRGFKHGVEYRYVIDAESKGAVMYDYLNDRQIDDGTLDSTGDNEDSLDRKRWWFRMKNDQDLPAGFKAKLDVDLVSDHYFLREFDSGYSGYEASDSYFLKGFGRELDDYTDTIRLNHLNLNRGWDKYSLNIDFRWYDDVIIRKNDLPDTTLQNLPSVNFAGSKQEISHTPFYFDLDSSYNHFWRDVGTRGYSLDLHPRAYYPVRFGKYLDFEPSVGVRETLWRVEEYEDETLGKEDHLESREIYDLKADLSTEISRVFNLEARTVDKIKHAIRPQVVYEYVPAVEQEDLPDFVETIAEKNLITYSVTNYFTARTSKRPRPDSETRLDGEQEEKLLPPKYSYHDFCRFKFTQSYDIVETDREKNGEERRPFSPVKGEIEFTLSRYLDLQADAEWCTYDDEFKSYNAILGLSDRRGDFGSVDYVYTRENGTDEPGTRSVITKIFLKLFGPVAVYLEHERNLKTHENVKSVIGFKYEPQCWSLDFSYTDDRTTDKRECLVGVSLFGLGEF